MKKNGIITGILFMLFIAGNGYLNAQRGIRGLNDSIRMNRMSHGNDSLRFKKMRAEMDSIHIRRMLPGRSMKEMGPVPGHNMRGFTGRRSEYGMKEGFRREPGFGMRNDFVMDPADHELMGRGRVIGNIPNLTDKQKKEIADLRQTQMDEMKKVREESLIKVKTIRDSHRSKILNLLTDEQKKYFESVTGSEKTITPKSK